MKEGCADITITKMKRLLDFAYPSARNLAIEDIDTGLLKWDRPPSKKGAEAVALKLFHIDFQRVC